MPKPSERSKRMRRLADEAVDAELAGLKAKRERLRAIADGLGQWRDQSQHIRQLAQELETECGVTKTRLAHILGIRPREATVIWPAANVKRKPSKQDTAEGQTEQSVENGTEPATLMANVPLPAAR
ncbi:hypothetical protein OZX62_05135 [Bifidobacterium sp. ESL0690]|uniref:hypothetical protein n=1 Tax=Bifidobacterium sp. ESL0690 TaxID=2983214 RepID=UPI0023F69186|nr:hypothetical protein [Bifidobacterium sp. ESL0690]WEV47646.1 hypothetical protein OZX62_05135 [Bifidobacterium sp. ESL0690]